VNCYLRVSRRVFLGGKEYVLACLCVSLWVSVDVCLGLCHIVRSYVHSNQMKCLCCNYFVNCYWAGISFVIKHDSGLLINTWEVGHEIGGNYAKCLHNGAAVIGWLPLPPAEAAMNKGDVQCFVGLSPTLTCLTPAKHPKLCNLLVSTTFPYQAFCSNHLLLDSAVVHG